MSYTHDEVEKVIKDKGCELLSYYIKAKEKLDIRFQCGHIQKMSLCTFRNKKQRGHGPLLYPHALRAFFVSFFLKRMSRMLQKR